MVKSETLDPERLLDALKAGEFYSSQGPRIYDIEVNAKEARVECSPVHTIALVTSASAALSRVGRGLTHATIEFAEAAKWAWTEPPPVKWFRIVVIDGPRRRAWTNPIWVERSIKRGGRTRPQHRAAADFALAPLSPRPYIGRLPKG